MYLESYFAQLYHFLKRFSQFCFSSLLRFNFLLEGQYVQTYEKNKCEQVAVHSLPAASKELLLTRVQELVSQCVRTV